MTVTNRRCGPGRPRGPGRPKSMPARAARSGKRVRRSSEDVEATAAKFLAFVKGNDGKRLEEISRGLRIPTANLKLPAQKLLAATSLPLAYAVRAGHAGRRQAALSAVTLAFAVQAAYLVVQAHLYLDGIATLHPSANAYASIYFTLIGAHHAQIADDAAHGRALPRPEPDVVDQQKEEEALLIAAVRTEEGDDDEDQQKVEREGGEAIEEISPRKGG